MTMRMKRLLWLLVALVLILVLVPMVKAGGSDGHWMMLIYNVFAWHEIVPTDGGLYGFYASVTERADNEARLYRALIEIRARDPEAFDDVFLRHNLALRLPKSVPGGR